MAKFKDIGDIETFSAVGLPRYNTKNKLYGTAGHIPIHANYTHALLIGNSTSNYGYWEGVYGIMFPRIHEGYTMSQLRVSTSDNNFLYAFEEGQITDVTEIEIEFEGYDSNPVTFTWSINAYKKIDIDLVTFFQANAGENIGLNIVNL